MLSCKDVVKTVLSEEDRQDSWITRWDWGLHLIMCRHCSRFVRELRIIREAAAEIFTETEQGERARESPLSIRILSKLREEEQRSNERD